MSFTCFLKTTVQTGVWEHFPNVSLSIRSLSPTQQTHLFMGALASNKLSAPVPSHEGFPGPVLTCRSETLCWLVLGLQAHLHSPPPCCWELPIELGHSSMERAVLFNNQLILIMLPGCFSFHWHDLPLHGPSPVPYSLLRALHWYSYLISPQFSEVNILIHLDHKAKQNPKSRSKTSLEFNPHLFGRVNILGNFLLRRRQY